MSVLAVVPSGLVLASSFPHMSGQLGGLTDDARFSEAHKPLMRLTEPRWATEASAAMSQGGAAGIAAALGGLTAHWAAPLQPRSPLT